SSVLLWKPFNESLIPVLCRHTVSSGFFNPAFLLRYRFRIVDVTGFAPRMRPALAEIEKLRIRRPELPALGALDLVANFCIYAFSGHLSTFSILIACLCCAGSQPGESRRQRSSRLPG
ncbi:hypothetical protein, partial [Herminiimonas sp. CN]|uniref:hypothetical protein n=1 Tax=Herminiimonas sp. CN TaxID=1349818 RepID=UPI001EE63C1A